MLSIYIHYPFCKAKCPYCDFNSHVRDFVDHEDFLRAYENELEFFAGKIGKRKISTIFFGGGTPSLMPIFLVEGILQKIAALWSIDENCEITLEANPTSAESAKFKDLKRIGVNRLSLGIQALNDQDLKFLGREHSAKEAMAAIEMAAKIFDNFSFDLIYARPKQSLESWVQELSRAIDFGSKHLSLYQLTIEKGTRFFSDFQQKKFELPDEELAAQFYEMTSEITSDAGFEAYEISNYAQKNYQSRHNLVYWQGGDYLGIGAGAHSRIYFSEECKRSAISMLCEPISWLKKAKEQGAGIQKIEKISEEELQEELILMGLRLKDGIANEVFQAHLQKNISEIFEQKKLQKLVNQGLIEIDRERIKIPNSARLLTNSIITKLCDMTNLKALAIKPAQVCDMNQMIEICAQNLVEDNHEKSDAAALSKRGFLIRKLTVADLDEMLGDQENHFACVAKNGDEVLGYLTGCDIQKIKIDLGNLSELQKIKGEKIFYHKQIAKKAGVRNVGKELLLAMFAEAKSRSYRYVICRIVHQPFRNEASISFHEKFGFKEIAVEEENDFVFGIYLKDLQV